MSDFLYMFKSFTYKITVINIVIISHYLHDYGVIFWEPKKL